MGLCTSSESNTPEGHTSKDIDKELMNLSRDSRKECKVLLLGTGESGKTTIIKQLRIIHTVPFDDELGTWKENIHSNVITSMSALVKALEKSDQLNDLDDALIENAHFITSPKVLTSTSLSPEITQSIKNLWANKIVKDRFQNKSDVQIIDSAGYFFDNLDVSPKKITFRTIKISSIRVSEPQVLPKFAFLSEPTHYVWWMWEVNAVKEGSGYTVLTKSRRYFILRR